MELYSNYIIIVVVVILLMPTLISWVEGAVAGVWLNPLQLLLMPLRKVRRRQIVQSLVEAKQAGLTNVTRKMLEAHAMSGGDVTKLIHALVSADKANLSLSFKDAAAIDLAGRNVLEAVRTSVNPKVIDTPAVEAVAKDGIQVIVKARITIKSDIQSLIGGAGEDTILARVGECIVTAIGAAETHETLMEKPDIISKIVLQRNLDEGTAYKIMSVDIADVDLGENVGAKLQIERANADREIANAKAEERRSMAVALEQEMKAEQVRAEAAVPKALATALANGNMGYIDFYRLKNLQADTALRENMSNSDSNAVPTFNINNDNDDFFNGK